MTPDQVQKDILRRVKKGAKARSIEFTITMGDVVWPTYCPVLGIRLDYSPAVPSMGMPPDAKRYQRPDAPSIDRTDSGRGYVPGNVVVMSWRANRLKCDATAEEIELLAGYMRLKGEKNG